MGSRLHFYHVSDLVQYKAVSLSVLREISKNSTLWGGTPPWGLPEYMPSGIALAPSSQTASQEYPSIKEKNKPLYIVFLCIEYITERQAEGKNLDLLITYKMTTDPNSTN